MRNQSRRYRMTPEGEAPVFASPRRLAQMGREDAQTDHARGQSRPRYGNVTYDQAYAAERTRLQVDAFMEWEARHGLRSTDAQWRAKLAEYGLKRSDLRSRLEADDA